jgi:hypothetical protein
MISTRPRPAKPVSTHFKGMCDMDRLDQTILVAFAADILARLNTVHKTDFARLGELEKDYVSATIVAAFHDSRATDAEICRDVAHELLVRQFVHGDDI